MNMFKFKRAISAWSVLLVSFGFYISLRAFLKQPIWRFTGSPLDVAKVNTRIEEWHRYSKMSSNKSKTKRLPDVVGIGAKKCGTDAVITFLRHHPFVKTPDDLETFFFSHTYVNGLEYYKNLMPEVADHELVMEKTPAYFNSPPIKVPDRIKKDMPQAKIILVLCEPLKRAFSDYTHERVRWKRFGAKWMAKFDTFDSYLDEYLDRVNRTLVGSNENIVRQHMHTYFSDHSATILETGMYSLYLPRWTRLFDDSKLLILNGDDLMRDLGPHIELLQDFLGIPKLLKASDFVRHPDTGYFCIRPYWKNYCYELEQKSVTGWQEQLSCLSQDKGRTRHSKISATEEHMDSLKRLYRKFNDELFAMTGIRYV